jgi:hypothetical protein
VKHLLIAFIFSFSIMAHAQEKVAPTSQFSIEGKVKNKLVFGFRDAAGYSLVSLDSLVIYNHLHERKRALNNIKGILLKDILTKAGIDEASPKLLSEYYIVCIASDGYKVVFSWNELFNTETGNHILIATEAGGMKGEAMADRMLLLSSSDTNTGRRFVKGLNKIVVERAS